MSWPSAPGQSGNPTEADPSCGVRQGTLTARPLELRRRHRPQRPACLPATALPCPAHPSPGPRGGSQTQTRIGSGGPSFPQVTPQRAAHVRRTASGCPASGPAFGASGTVDRAIPQVRRRRRPVRPYRIRRHPLSRSPRHTRLCRGGRLHHHDRPSRPSSGHVGAGGPSAAAAGPAVVKLRQLVSVGQSQGQALDNLRETISRCAALRAPSRSE